MRLFRPSNSVLSRFSLALFLILFLTLEAGAMGLFSKLVLFSEVEGVVTMNGAPVEGAEITQQAIYSDTDFKPKFETTTDTDGRFRFDAVTKSAGLARLSFDQFSTLQILMIKVDGKEYEAWRHTKFSPDPGTETKGGPFKLVCELTDDPDYEDDHWGVCRLKKQK